MNLFAAENPGLAAAWENLLALAHGDAVTGELPSDELQEFFALYGPVAAPKHIPFVIGQLGQSLDGYIATRSGASHYVTGPESLIHLHRLRALCDAVVVGWRTVATDDPQLTVRHVKGPNPLRVIIDLNGRLAADRRAFSEPGALRLTGRPLAPIEGVESIPVATRNGRFDPAAIVALLVQRGCRRILVEGGGATVSSFLAAGALDRLHLAIAPLLIGEGVRGLTLPSINTLNDALRPLSRAMHMGRDVLFDCDLKDGR